MFILLNVYVWRYNLCGFGNLLWRWVDDQGLIMGQCPYWGTSPLPSPLLHLDHSRVSRNPHPPEYWVTRAVSQEPHIFPTIPHACELPGWEYLLWKNGGGRWCRSRGSKCCHLASHMVFRSVLKGVLAVDWLIFRMQQKLLKLWKKSQVFPNNLKMEWYMWFLCYVKGWGIYEACKSWIGQKSFSGSKQDKMALIEYRSALLKIFRLTLPNILIHCVWRMV